MATTKNLKCSKCKEMKPSTSFAKSFTEKSGHQAYCKQCKKAFQDPYMKADKNALIYKITNPIGEVYIGSTKREFHIRINTHRGEFNFRPGTFPKLHESFSNWGFDAHLFEIVVDCGNISKTEMHEIERNMIKALRVNGKLLNA
jgi:hypothetical protein